MSSVSDSEHSEAIAFHELDQLVRRLADELASFRRRALQAEARVKEMEGGQSPASGDRRHRRSSDLERENAALRHRLDAATKRTRQLLDRVHFLRQQHGARTAKGAAR